MKYRVDECFTCMAYGKKTDSSMEKVGTIEGHSVYETCDGWGTGAEAKFFDTLDEAIDYCEEMSSYIAWLEYGKETTVNNYSIVEINEDEEEFGTDNYFTQNYEILKLYAVVIQKCKVIGTEEDRAFTTEISEFVTPYNIYENSVDDNFSNNQFFVSLEDAQEFCEYNKGRAAISLNKEISCKKYSIYSVCEDVAKAKKIESEKDLGYLEEVIYPEFYDCD